MKTGSIARQQKFRHKVVNKRKSLSQVCAVWCRKSNGQPSDGRHLGYSSLRLRNTTGYRSRVWSFLLILSSGPKWGYELSWRKFAWCVSWRYDRTNYAQNPMLLCVTCHVQSRVMVHNKVASFRQSWAKRQGNNFANYCMPAIERKQSLQSYTAIKRRKYTWRRSRSKSLLKQSDRQVMVTAINETGHVLPGDGLRAI